MLYNTKDIYFAATLLAYGYLLTSVDKKEPKHMIFVFEDAEKIRPIERAYLNKEVRVEVSAFREALIRLKGIVHSS